MINQDSKASIYDLAVADAFDLTNVTFLVTIKS